MNKLRTLFKKEYASWDGLRQRCLNPNHHKFHRYGGRGIKVCERWNSFVSFLEDMGEKPSPEHTIDRIDNNGDYTPDNCKWSTQKEQASNRGNNHKIIIGGEEKTLSEWSRVSGLAITTLLARIKAGYNETQLLGARRSTYLSRQATIKSQQGATV